MESMQLRNYKGKQHLSLPLSRLIAIGALCLSLVSCQTSSSSSTSSPSMPSPSSSSSSSPPSSPNSSSSSNSSQSQGTPGAPSSQSGQQSSQSTTAGGQPSANSSSADQQPGQENRDGSRPGAQAAQQDSQSTRSAAGSTPAGTLGSSSGQGAGSQARLPGAGSQPGVGRDESTGDLDGGLNQPKGSGIGSPSGDYSLDTLPDGALSGRNASGSGRRDSNGQASSGSGDGGAQTSGNGAMTAQERAEVLDEQLRRGYETFDGFILSERERAQAESNAAGSSAAGGSAGGGSSSSQPQTLPESGASAVLASSLPPGISNSPPQETFPAPEDIPSGRDDDVVARQLREAAMSEPDPQLREALWQEYRNYTGLGEEQ